MRKTAATNMTKKARFIKAIDSLSPEEKARYIAFFTTHPVYESEIDWNRKDLSPTDFARVRRIAENSRKNRRRQAKADPASLFAGHNCMIIARTDTFLVAVPLDWKCAVFFNSFECGGEGARWCIGSRDSDGCWANYRDDGYIFLVIFLQARHFFW